MGRFKYKYYIKKFEFFEGTKKSHRLGEWVTFLLPFDLMPSAAHVYLFAGKVWSITKKCHFGSNFLYRATQVPLSI